MNDALREARAVDPKWAKSEQRKLWLLKGVTAAVMVALAVGTVSFVVGLHNSTEITNVEHSACQVEPAGGECQKAKAESSEAANLRVTCIPFFKAGYPCPKPGSTAAERVARRQSLRAHPVQGSTPNPSKSVQGSGSGGDANSNPSTGHSPPGRHEGGSSGSNGAPAPGSGTGGSHHAPVPGEAGSEAAPAPGTASVPAPAAPTSPGASSSSTTERTKETSVEERSTPEAGAPEAPVRQGVGAALESVGGVVEETGATVNGTVGGVTGTTCSLAKVLCHE